MKKNNINDLSSMKNLDKTESQPSSYNEYKPKYEQPSSVTQKTQTTSYESYSPAKNIAMKF